MQKSIKQAISFRGVGLHSGNMANITLKPAQVNTGVVFIRTDVVGNNRIAASFSNVVKTELCTAIRNEDGIEVATIEHLMAAIWVLGINNLIIEIDSREVPTLDGSAEEFFVSILKVGVDSQDASSQAIKVVRNVLVALNDKSIEISPSESLIIDFNIKFDSKCIGSQSYIFDISKDDFASQISKARTFGFVDEMKTLQSKGLAMGASLSNAIGISGDEILNQEGLRYKDEFVRHKILDCLGDLSLAGMPIIGYVKAVKAGHALNNMLLHKIFQDSGNYILLDI